MSAYSISIFLHVVAALAVFAGIGLEWSSLHELRQARTVDQVRQWIRPLGVLRRVGGPAMLVLLVTGIYMGATRWGHQPWIGLGLVGMVLMAVAGVGLSGRRMAGLMRAIPGQDGPVPPPLAARLQDPVLRVSAWLRTGIGVGIVYLMTVKPGRAEALIALLVAIGAGLAAGLAGYRGRAVQSQSPLAER